MDILILCQLIFLGFCIESVRPSPSHDCVSDCIGVRNDDYQSCEGCQYYVTCHYGEMTTTRCPSRQEWDSKRNICRFGKSRTCSMDDSSEEVTTLETEFHNDELQKISTENSNNMEDFETSRENMKELIDEYIIPMSIGFCVFIVIIFSLLVLWKFNWCRELKGMSRQMSSMPVHVSVTSVGTQTGESSDSSDYQELHYIPQRAWVTTPPVRYMSMPYAVSEVHKYQDLTVPYADAHRVPENEYLELLAYSYTQIQDDKIRDKVNDMMTPIVKVLCSEDKDNAEYVSLEKKLKTIADELKEKKEQSKESV